ncbi:MULTISPECIES: ImmA/IrrE family metallo-endopeptidase [Deinococcus]|uniref:ImmA/IrrE family metallo-endopeptidase n=1 Tax=Deinococcus rufus TaxID=2136097 RepID=A0ABV7ZC70_9DEIO|nr:ImmA/IrrE family metallo-endopeptidase [Deinococcus sp. AB2017081]WQE94976.1 ImmA/IrrE family metallo-endopeptidase [Deinococcus sp. AB2017081]
MITTLHDLQPAFHTWLDEWHAAQGFESDYRVLADTLGLTVKAATRSMYDAATQTIYIERNLHPLRERHEGLHEVTHHLFQTAQAGAFHRAAQQLGKALKSRQDAEEGIVQEASWRLLMPPHRVNEVCRVTTTDVEAMVQLARMCRASFEFAAWRVAGTLTRPVRGVVLDSRGWVLASFGNNVGTAKYTPGRGFFVDAMHPLQQITETNQVVEFKAAIPFKRGRVGWRVSMEAWKDSKRFQTLAVFDTRISKNHGMEPLLEVDT